MGNQQFVNFFRELLNRVATKSPKFFKVLQLFGASLTFAGYIPSMLQQWFNVTVPGYTITMCEDIGKYAAGFFACSLLAVKTPTVGQTVEGSPVQVTNEKAMPFTAKSEAKEVAAAKPPEIVLPQVPEEPKDP